MVADEQIQQWADEAEAGYDVEELKRRGRGRPGRGAEPMQVVTVRLIAEEIEALDDIAKKQHLSRSEAIRRALANFYCMEGHASAHKHGVSPEDAVQAADWPQ